MDEFSARSHRRVLAAQKEGRFAGEIASLFDRDGNLYGSDDGVREDSTRISQLRPFFDRKYGNVTAGNSSQITDGAAWLVLLRSGGGEIRSAGAGKIVDSEWAGLDPAQMSLGPYTRPHRCSSVTA
jgi:acetyl-CoA C-acetyltransferase